MKVLKFGGTSVGSPERMKSILPLIMQNKPAIVVLSAMAGTTDKLVKLSSQLYINNKDSASVLIEGMETDYKKVAEELFRDSDILIEAGNIITLHFDHLRSFTQDMFTIQEEKAVLAQGELLSTSLFHLLCKEKGINSKLLPALNFMRIDENEEPDLNYIERNLIKELVSHPGFEIYITQGYICRNKFGEIDNLKRGGSDYTATLLGAALNAEEVQIWTDIDGIHNNDPRYVDNTFAINEISFEEAAELAYFGAKILHPTCILPAKNRGIPVKLLNTMNPEAEGTIIRNETDNKSHVKAVAAKDGITAIKIKSDRMLLAYGFLRAIFEVFERYKTPIDMITTSEVAVSLTIDNNQFLENIVTELNEYGSVEVEEDLTIICIVGNVSPEKSGIAAKIFNCINNIPIRMISFGGSQNNISLLVKTAFKSEALNALNEGIF